MNMSSDSIPNATLEAIARSFYRETIRYGFRQVDYLRFVNFLLDLSLKNGSSSIEPKEKTTTDSNEENSLLQKEN